MRPIPLSLAVVIACWAGVGAAATRAKPHPRPKAAPLALTVGQTVSINGTLYTITYGLTPIGAAPVPTPVPVPTPIPIPVPVPTPAPGPAPFVSGYRDGQRNPATLFSPGATVFIEGSNFGPLAGTLSVNNQVVKVYAWTDTEIAIVAPPYNGYPPGPVILTIFCLDKRFLTTAPAFTLR